MLGTKVSVDTIGETIYLHIPQGIESGEKIKVPSKGYKDGKYGYVNKDGVVIVDYIYDDAKEQNAFGYASIKKDGLWGCINSQGKEVVAPTYVLENNSLIEFINQWYRGEDLNLNYYTNE